MRSSCGPRDAEAGPSGSQPFSFLDGFSIICGPGAAHEERKIEQLFTAIKMVDLERSMLCITKGTPVNSKDKVRTYRSFMFRGFSFGQGRRNSMARCLGH
jgi:hypothetical protein